jgi:primosomal protein N' (replication factor Y) (superfamily II helicase)
VDVSLPHLDRPFEYLVPESLDAVATPGCRVRVRFAGRLTNGFLLERRAEPEHQGQLGYLERVVSPERVLTPEIAELARAVADHYGGTLADVLRLAIPPRHAAAEAKGKGAGATAAADPAGDADGAGAAAATAGQAEARVAGSAGDAAQAGAGAAVDSTGEGAAHAGGRAAVGRAAEIRATAGERDGHGGARDESGLAGARAEGGLAGAGSWGRYPAGRAFLGGVAAGRAPRAVWSALPGGTWAGEIGAAVAVAAKAGRGALVVVPDARDLELVDVALAGALGPGEHVILSASLGPAERYRRWLAVLRGQVSVVAGLRSAMFAPVADLGLVVLWDDGDDLLAEPRAPYPHAREVLALRAHRVGAAALIGGFARTAEAAQLLARGWARPLEAERATVRRFAPAVAAAGDDAELARDEAARSARLPSLALRTAREALARGPVLFQTPRRGYLAALACERCHAQRRCRCGGPVQLGESRGAPACGWCGSVMTEACPSCGHRGLRALVIGAARTAEELGRAFPAIPVRTSGGSRVLATVPSSPAVVVATPGAEPDVEGGYAAAVLLDGWALLGRASLRAAEEALRRWMNAAALVRPGPDGGRVVIVAEASLPAVQALVRWDPATFAERELAERRELRFPPAARMAALSGPHEAVRVLLDRAELPAGAEVLGPVPVPAHEAIQAGGDGEEQAADTVRFLVRAPRSGGAALAAALRSGQAARTARKEVGAVRLVLDPAELI